MFGNVFAPLNASPTPAAPRAAAIASVRMKPVIRLARLPIAIVRLDASRLRLSSAGGSSGSEVACAAGCGRLIVGDGPVPLRPDVCRDAPRDIGLVRWLQHDLADAVKRGSLQPSSVMSGHRSRGHNRTAVVGAGGLGSVMSPPPSAGRAARERSVGGGNRR